ncbi:MAG: hypothetical protein JWQ89_255 [Devosia sp.]|uniref:hypothetical protein n=1 Tax=Devosia sp. TaxID=1871048 RepID=UPI002612BC30|nr:hypothetical protein [Devosia sp.]MDB5538528.1 hypothetical protein [Devosia sp.]
MAKALYLVIHSCSNWWVDLEGKAHGPYTSRETAALEARSLARFQAHSGREAEVLVPDEHGKFWVIWSSLYDSGEGRSFTPRRVAS